MDELGPIDIKRRTGTELFCDRDHPLEFDLLSFWQWSASDVVTNATRGILAEYLVGQALGVAPGSVREEWAAYDLETHNGTRVEVKSAAFIQSWPQKALSRISFMVPKTRAWDKETNRHSHEAKRQADVYVFALLGHTDQQTIDPLNVSQWEFFVLPTVRLDRRERSQHSITLPSLRKLANSVAFAELSCAVDGAACIQKRSGQQAAEADAEKPRR